MRVLVCGSRTFSADRVVWEVLDGLYRNHEVGYLVLYVEPLTIIDGGAAGADRCATSWVHASPLHGPLLERRPEVAPDECYVMHEQYPADWNTHGRAAGPIRNQQMLDMGKPDEVWAFIDKPLEESRGTADMVRRAVDTELPVRVVRTM